MFTDERLREIARIGGDLNDCAELAKLVLEMRAEQFSALPAKLPVHLEPHQRVYLETMLAAGPKAVVTHAQLMRAAGSHAVDGNRPDIGMMKITHVVMCKMRRKLEPLGVIIETVWGKGYTLPQAGRDAWQNALDTMEVKDAAE